MLEQSKSHLGGLTRAPRALALLGAIALTTLSLASAATRTITGQIVYGPVRDDLGEFSDPAKFIPDRSPIAHVTVQLNGTFKEGDDITDANGRFSIGPSFRDGSPAR